VLALAPDGFDSLLMAREFKMAGTNAASRQNQSNQLAISNSTFARGPSTYGFGRGMPDHGRGCGAALGEPASIVVLIRISLATGIATTDTGVENCDATKGGMANLITSN
jgi:hypothetical protein